MLTEVGNDRVNTERAVSDERSARTTSCGFARYNRAMRLCESGDKGQRRFQSQWV